jgi:hypothetical protein
MHFLLELLKNFLWKTSGTVLPPNTLGNIMHKCYMKKQPHLNWSITNWWNRLWHKLTISFVTGSLLRRRQVTTSTMASWSLGNRNNSYIIIRK